MRVRVCVGVRLPLKQSKRVAVHGDTVVVVSFLYEKLPILCFIYGRLGHNEVFVSSFSIRMGGRSCVDGARG